MSFNSCLNMNDPKEQAEYIKALKTYHSSLTEHIPSKIPNNQVGYGFSSSIVNNYSDFYIRTKEKKENYFTIKERFINGSYPFIPSNDSSIMIYESMDKLKLEKKKFDYKIVPQYLYEDHTEYNTSKLMDYNFDIIILKSKFESLPSSIDYMDMKTNDGTLANNYFSGVAFYDKDLIITYWLITW